MEVLVNKPFNYAVLIDGDNAFIVVVCGTSALYDVWVQKTKAEAHALFENDSSLNAIVNAVRLNPRGI